MRFGGLTYEGLCGRGLAAPGHYEALHKNAPFSTILHFTPLQPNLKNISKIYLWINPWITMISNQKNLSNQTYLPVDNYKTRVYSNNATHPKRPIYTIHILDIRYVGAIWFGNHMGNYRVL